MMQMINEPTLGEKVLSFYRNLVLISILFAAATLGCAQQRAAAPEKGEADPHRAMVDQPEASSSPVISKGSGIKKKLPVKVKTGDRLGWVDNALKTYPPDQFVTGLGIAPERKTAQQRAFRELAKPFDKSIAGRIKVLRKALGKLPAPLDQEWNTMAENNRSHALEITMEQARVAEIFIERLPQPTVYTLAVLNRSDATRLLKPMIRRLDRQLQELIEQNEVLDNRTSINRNKPLQTLIQRESLNAALSAATQEGRGIPLSFPPQTIARMLKKNSKKN